jgi:colicin import membrane protein
MATADALELRREPALGRAALLAAAMHVVLIALMFIGVKWQSYDPDTVTVELWEPQPVPQETVEPPKPAPPPPPKVEAPKPEPKVEKPDITLRDKAKPKPKPKAEPKPKPDLEFERQIREQAAMEQRAMQEQQKLLEDQRRAAEAARKERELQALLARQAADAKAKAVAAWIDRIRNKIRSNIVFAGADELPGNPTALFDVVQLPTGEVISATLRRSSGIRAYDQAVEHAIHKSSPLPRPDDPALFDRRLELTFRPKDK